MKLILEIPLTSKIRPQISNLGGSIIIIVTPVLGVCPPEEGRSDMTEVQFGMGLLDTLGTDPQGQKVPQIIC